MQLPIWMPGLGHVNTYGLLDDRGLAVVDPGLPGPQSWKALKTRLKSAGFKLRDIHTVVVTHSHPDHFGGAGRIAREAGAELITHRAFTTWSLDRKTRKQQARLSRREAEQLERDAAAVAESVDVSPDELPTVAEVGDDDRDRDTGDPLLDDPTVERQRQSVPWGGETPWGGSKHPMPPFRRRVMIRAIAACCSRRPTRRVASGTASACDSPGASGSRCTRRVTPSTTSASTTRSTGSSSPATTCSRRSRRTSRVSATAPMRSAATSPLSTSSPTSPACASVSPRTAIRSTTCPGASRRSRRHHQERMDLLGAASAALGPASVQELSHELFPKKHWGVMAESETFAHLEHLVLEGRRRAPPRGRQADLHGRSRFLTGLGSGSWPRRADDPTAEATDLLQRPDPQPVRERRARRVGPGDQERRPARQLPRGRRPRHRALRAPARPQQPRRPHRGQRSEGAVAAPDGPHRRRAGEPGRVEPRPVRRRDRRRVRLGTRRRRHAQRDRHAWRVAFRRLADSGFKPTGTLTYLAVADEEALGTWGAKWLVENERDAVYADYVLTESGGFQIPTPDGAAPPGDGRREGHVLVEAHRQRNARPRVAAVPHRQRGRHRGRGRAAPARVPAPDSNPRHVARVRRGHGVPARVPRRPPRRTTSCAISPARCRSACRGSCTRARTRRSRRP